MWYGVVSQESGCPLPCTTFSTSTRHLVQQAVAANYSRINLTFGPTVSITNFLLNISCNFTPPNHLIWHS